MQPVQTSYSVFVNNGPKVLEINSKCSKYHFEAHSKEIEGEAFKVINPLVAKIFS